MKTNGSIAVKCMSFLGGVTGSELLPFVRNLNRGTIPIAFFAYSLESGSIVLAHSLIAIIIRTRSFPKVIAPVIKRIVVLVVSFASVAFFQSENLPVHGNERSFSVNHNWPVSIKTFPSFVPMRILLPLVKPFIILWRHLHKQTLGNRNDTIIFRWGRHAGTPSCIGLGRMLEHPTTPFYDEVPA